MLIVKLKPGKEIPLIKGHPWAFSGAVEDVEGEQSGLCRVLDAKGRFVAQGFYNPRSNVAIRVLSLEKAPIDEKFLRRRIEAAAQLRQAVIPAETDCYRLLNAEGDNLPGLVIDRYGQTLIIQFGCPGAEEFKDAIVTILHSLFPGFNLYERSDLKGRRAEGLQNEYGPLDDASGEADTVVTENGLKLAVNVFTGDQTGLYLDRREIRSRVAQLAAGKTVLDLCSYSAATALSAAKAGAESVTAVDNSAQAIGLARKSLELNSLSAFSCKLVKDDAARFLNQDAGNYDLIICDPPIGEEEDYVRLNGLAMRHLNKGGRLVTMVSQQSSLSEDSLLRVINKAAQQAERQAQMIETLRQGPDFPYLPGHPEGRNLYGALVYVR